MIFLNVRKKREEYGQWQRRKRKKKRVGKGRKGKSKSMNKITVTTRFSAQRTCGCPIPEDIQGQVGCSPGQPDLMVGNPAHGRGVELDHLQGPFQLKSFYDSKAGFVFAIIFSVIYQHGTLRNISTYLPT